MPIGPGVLMRQTNKENVMPAYFDSGFCVRQPSWHGLEVLLQEAPESWDDGRLAAGLMWEPRAVEVYRKVYVPAGAEVPLVLGTDGEPIKTEEAVLETHDDGGRVIFQSIPNLKGVERDDSGSMLGVRTADYGLITHATMGEFADLIQQEFGENMKLDTMGSCRGGRQVWAVLRLDEPFKVLRDESLTYPLMTLLNNHAGNGKFTILNTNLRTVCANTFAANEANAEANPHLSISITHRGDMTERIEEAKAAIAGLRAGSKEWEIQANELAAINVDDAFIRTFAEQFIPTPENATPQVTRSRQERRDLFMSVLNGVTCENHSHTAYGVVQAAGEYLDHFRPFKNRDTYLARTILNPEPIKTGVIKLVREMAAAN